MMTGKKSIIKIGLIAFMLSSLHSKGQIAPDTYWVSFTDKNHNIYSLDEPEAFLSARALERREKYNINIDITDLPVSSYYVDSLRNMGLIILGQSKWLNGVIVKSVDSLLLDTIGNISFIEGLHIGKRKKKSKGPDIEISLLNPYSKFVERSKKRQYVNDMTQINMLNGNMLHDMGYLGEGIQIAVIDAGFYHAKNLPALSHLWEENKILGSRDFTNQDYGIFDGDTHGMYVLSVMGGKIPGEFSGTAPEASYWLLRSEVVSSEYPVEEYYWTIAAEFADSVGVDVINTSLGYSIFYSAPDKSYSYEDMNGNTTVVTNSADMAASKGILVVASAGNEGNDPWKYITSPADGDSVLSVGSVNAFKEYSVFSSIGPTSDNRIKPNIVAMGENTLVQLPNMSIGPKIGTSFSAPLIAGISACLWQAYPDMNNMEILNTIEKSAHQYNMPDDLLGYGVPDMMKAFKILQIENNTEDQYDIISLYPSFFHSGFKIEVYSKTRKKVKVDIFDLSGRNVYSDTFIVNPVFSVIEVNDLNNIPEGIYLIHITSNKTTWQQKVIKH